jgi:Tol biopolymer transport system component
MTGGGKIVYVCQIFRVTESDQICIMDSDGNNQRRLTSSDTARHFYPSLSPDGQSVLFSSNMDGRFYIYELKLSGELTNLWQTGIAPEVSPDGRLITFTQNDGKSDTIWVMNRDGSNPRLVYSNGWDPTWSPDGQKILFASQVGGLSQLMTINLDGTGLQQVSDLPLLRGRSDWSEDGRFIVTYSGRSWERELFLLPLDGSPVRQLTPPGGNSQGPTFSPDGQWVAFTAYFDRFRNVHGCEIYKMRIDGTQLTRLTSNDYCDWQPRWGP